MIIMKFGGTSLRSAETIRIVEKIVRSNLERGPVVVVSAHSGVTNMLVDLGAGAPHGDVDTSAVAERHRVILGELGLPINLVDPLLAELGDLTRGMRLVSEASPRALDYLLSFGERCSARIVAASMTRSGLRARAIDAFDAGLRTDGSFGRARPLPDDGRMSAALAELDGEIPVLTGFIAKDERGNITTLGRNGSDLSAALFGNALSAEEIQIWTDVDGVMTADPGLVRNAQSIEVMSFDEASELAYYGARVLHPATILPAMEKSIPVRVLNTHRPESPGTLIVPAYDEEHSPVRAVVYKEGIHLVSVISPRMLQQSGYLSEVFGIAARHEIDIGLVATSEVSITMSTDCTQRIGDFVEELGRLGEVHVEDRQALIGVVGHGIAKTTGVASQVLGCLADEGVRVRVISQGAIKVNVALVIGEGDVPRAVAALHGRFFGDWPG